MLDLAPETEALARNLAEARRVSVDEAVRGALEANSRLLHHATASSMSPEDLARRKARIDEIVAEMAALPDLDKRSTKEITDDLNPL